MKRLLISIVTISVVGVLTFGASRAFFSDIETSAGNVFHAGSLDLKVDSDCHYWRDGEDIGCGEGPGSGNWDLTNLESGIHKFFNFTDIKPGDRGEDTVSLHVYDNNAWVRMLIDVTEDSDNGCTEPELDADPDCNNPDDGELLENLVFWVWLDQGLTPGFGGKHVGDSGDRGEGNNVFDENDRILVDHGTIDSLEEWNISEALAEYRITVECPADPDGDGQTATGKDGCQGIAVDGRLVESTTYYFGIAWELPSEVGNEVQTDSLALDITFEVEQHRNNPSPFGP